MAGVTRDDSTQGEGDGCCIEAFGPFIFTGKFLLDGRFPSLPDVVCAQRPVHVVGFGEWWQLQRPLCRPVQSLGATAFGLSWRSGDARPGQDWASVALFLLDVEWLRFFSLPDMHEYGLAEVWR